MRSHDGLEINVLRQGPDDAEVTVVLAHCWVTDMSDWHYQTTALRDRYGDRIALLRWDARGHGGSDHADREACTLDNLARDMADVLDTFAPTGRLVLAGHSIGGMTMMALAERRPDLVARTDGALFCATSAGRLDTVTLGLPEMGRLVRSQVPRVLAQRARMLTRRQRASQPFIESGITRKLLFGDRMRLADRGLVVDQLITCPPATMEGFYRDLMRHDRVAALAAYADIPTVVMVGDRDVLTPAPHARRIAAAIPQARLLIAPGAGHMLPLERDELVTAELTGLIDQALARPAVALAG